MLRTFYVFFFTDPATTEIYTLSLHDALPILGVAWRRMRVTTLFVAGYPAIVVVWPFSPLRFVWGIWPLVMLFAAAGLATAWKVALVRQNRGYRSTHIAATVTLCLGMIVFNARGYANAWWSSNTRFHARRVLP